MKLINLIALLMVAGCAGQKVQEKAPQQRALEIQKIHYEYLGGGHKA